MGTRFEKMKEIFSGVKRNLSTHMGEVIRRAWSVDDETNEFGDWFQCCFRENIEVVVLVL